MNLALFDLDHTLIPFDSGAAWVRFLSAQGVVPRRAERAYLDLCLRDAAGQLDIRALHRACIGPLARHEPAQCEAWLADFAREAAPSHAPMQALVDMHRHAGDLLAIVTATSRPIARAFADAFDIEELVATEPECAGDRWTGEIAGEPCYRDAKPAHVAAWLARRGARLEDFARTWFYSDSANDLPLLQLVSDPVAVRPDERLRHHALLHGWPMIEST